MSRLKAYNKQALPKQMPLHFFPQAPQFRGSDAFTFTHLPLHNASPDAQLAPHWPFTHVVVPFATAGQALLQAPQFFRSVCRSAQPAPHASYGIWH